MPKPTRKKKMHKRVIVKTHPSYPTSNELWQSVQVRCDPMLNEQVLPGTLSGISAIPETISKWMDKTCRFAAGAAPTVPAAPTAGSVPATPNQGDAATTEEAASQGTEVQKLLTQWGTELTNNSTEYEHMFYELNRLNYASASNRIGRIVTRMQGIMTQLVDQIDNNEILKAYKSGDITDEIPTGEAAAGGEPTGMAALQKALYDLSEGGGPLGFLLNYETQFSSRSIPPVIRPGLNQQVVTRLQNSGYIQVEQNLIALTKQMSSLKNLPFKPILNKAIEAAKRMQGIIAEIGSARAVRTTR